jgi:hypothetical protein
MSDDKIVSLFGENPPDTQDVSVEETLASAAEAGFEEVLVIGYASGGGGHRLQYFSSGMTRSEIVWVVESMKYGFLQDEFS